ncbi:alpha-L-fucosidase [Tamlana agarivorans]|uniref:Alpha-L-fucosidase n=1 Tax=Pseudotamlana agarivorans TaxID=481183 RepID=A0ACC5U9B9_9FLAO|nr:alpha-L-fucosidase [Tamlana agarivorans]MBU2950897.1 alpha-L-fucosidase [Tamlana agarivorans]
MKKILLCALLISVSLLQAQEKKSVKKKGNNSSFEYRFPASLKQTPDSEARLNQWYKDAKFGAFIHFGVYSVLEGGYKDRIPKARYAEWIEVNAKMSVEEYHEVAKRFNPKDFNAEAWVKVFKDAGMKYVVITSKHHDGFALFESAVSDYNIVDYTPFKRDIIKELSDACHRNGLKFGVYYSQAQDWDDPNAPYLNPRRTKRTILHPNLPSDFKPDFDEYIKAKSLPQVEELMKNYEIDLIWFDTPAQMTFERAKLFSDVVRKYRPNCLINSRIIQGGKEKVSQKNLELFDYVSIADKEVPTQKLPLYVESPDCVSSSFGYKAKGDVFYHDEKEMLERMVHTVCTGGNYLLNNGPMGNGKLDPEAVRLYGIIGEWMKKNRVSIHNTRPNPFDTRPDWGDISTSKKGDVLYLHILNIPVSGEILLNHMPSKVTGVSYLENGVSVPFEQDNDGVRIKVSNSIKNSLDLVIKVTLNKPI